MKKESQPLLRLTGIIFLIMFVVACSPEKEEALTNLGSHAARLKEQVVHTINTWHDHLWPPEHLDKSQNMREHSGKNLPKEGDEPVPLTTAVKDSAPITEKDITRQRIRTGAALQRASQEFQNDSDSAHPSGDQESSEVQEELNNTLFEILKCLEKPLT